MIVETKVSGAYAKFLSRSLTLNSQLGSRISTAKLDILGEEYWPETTKTIYDNGYALSLDGLNDYVNCGGDASLDSLHTEGRTVEAWVKIKTKGTWQHIVSNFHAAGVREYLNVMDTNDHARYYLRDDDGVIVSVEGTSVITDDKWHYIVGVRRVSTGKLEIWVDNIRENTTNDTTTGDFVFARDLWIGEKNTNQWPVFGLIDEVRISNIARSSDEISAIENGGAGQQFEVDANTLALWHMNEGSGLTIYDETTNNNDGAITGATFVTGFVPRPIRTISAPGLSAGNLVGFGGYTHPYVKEDIVIDRASGGVPYIDHFFGGTVATKEIRLIGKRRIYRITGQDYNVDPTAQLVGRLAPKNYVAQTEQQIIDDLFSTYLPDIDTSTYVESSGVLSTLNWTRQSLDKVMDELAGIFEKNWYIDHQKKLHYFTPTTGTAPFKLSSSPVGITHIGYNRFRYLENARELHNRVTVVGDTTVPVVETRQDAASGALYGWYDWKIVDPNIDTAAWAQAVGDAELAISAWPKAWGQLTLHQEGLIIGQKVHIYNHGRNVNEWYTIQKLMMRLINNTTEEITIDYGDYSPDLIDILLAIDQEAKKE